MLVCQWWNDGTSGALAALGFHAPAKWQPEVSVAGVQQPDESAVQHWGDHPPLFDLPVLEAGSLPWVS